MAKKQTSVKLNVNYVAFIARVVKEKLATSSSQELAKLYTAEVKMRSFRNVSRVDARVKRPEVATLLTAELKARGISMEQFEDASEALIEKLDGRTSNYQTIEVKGK